MPLPERAAAFGRPKTPLRPIEGGALTVDEIKADLAQRVSRIPELVWQQESEDMHLPLRSGTIQSWLLPRDRRHTLDGRGNPLKVPIVAGGDSIDYMLRKDGIVIERLVYYHADRHGPLPKDTQLILGETDEGTYHRIYLLAIERLRQVEKRATEVRKPSP